MKKTLALPIIIAQEGDGLDGRPLASGMALILATSMDRNRLKVVEAAFPDIEAIIGFNLPQLRAQSSQT